MDKYLFEQFVTNIEDKDISNFFKYLLTNSQEKIDTKEKRYYQYYPQSKKGIKLVTELVKDKDNILNIEDFKFHHLSKQEWEFKIVTPMKTFRNTYLVKRPNNTGSSCIRIVNEEILDKELDTGTIIKGQVCGIVMIANIFKNEEEYLGALSKDDDGNKNAIKDGTLIPYNLLTNNDAKLSEDERNKRNHTRDNLLMFKSKIKKLKEKEISIFDIKLPNYYTATIETTYGELDIIIPNALAKKHEGKLKNGCTIIGELLLSCDLHKKKNNRKKEEK